MSIDEETQNRSAAVIGPTYNNQFLTPVDSGRYFKALTQLTWHQHIINMYGKKIPAPRKFVWMGLPPAKLYGHEVPVTDWTDVAIELLSKVHVATGVFYDSLNINMYRDGNDYLGWHIDPQDEGRWDYPILPRSRSGQNGHSRCSHTYSMGVSESESVTLVRNCSNQAAC